MKVFLKCQQILKDYKSQQNPLKMLKALKECFFGKATGPQSSSLSKDKLHYKHFSIDWSIDEFWNTMYIRILKMYCSWFSAVAACTFNWLMIDLLQNKDESLKWTASAFKCDQ